MEDFSKFVPLKFTISWYYFCGVYDILWVDNDWLQSGVRGAVSRQQKHVNHSSCGLKGGGEEEGDTAESASAPKRVRLRRMMGAGCEETGIGCAPNASLVALASQGTSKGTVAQALRRRAAVQVSDSSIWFRFSQTHCDKFTGGRSGFQQSSNSCYIASTLQAYFHTRSFAVWIACRSCSCARDICPSCMLHRTYIAGQNGDPPVDLSPWAVLVENCGLTWGRQQDVFDFITCLMNTWGVYSEVSAYRDFKLFQRHCFCNVPNTVRKQPRCSCPFARASESVLPETYAFLSLSPPPHSPSSVQQLLNEFLTAHEVPGGLSEYQCPVCGKESVVTQKKNVLAERGHLLLPIHIRRAQPDYVKNRCPVHIDAMLSVHENFYHLRSVTQHLGSTAHGGHYLAWIKRRRGYLIYDDAQRYICESEDMPPFISETVTTLLYERLSPFLQVTVHQYLLLRLSSFLVNEDAFNTCLACSHCLRLKPQTHGRPPSQSPVGFESQASGHQQSELNQDLDRSASGNAAASASRPSQMGPNSTSTRENVCMNEQSGSTRLDEDVAKLLQCYDAGEDLWEFLASLPHDVHNAEHPGLGIGGAAVLLERCLEDLFKDQVNANAAFEIRSFLGDTIFYPLAVLLQATCVAHGWAPVFVIDCVYSILSSLVHKELFVGLGQYKCRHRYWTNGVAPAGVGKSPCMKPFTKLILSVLRANSCIAVGNEKDDFHFQQSSTTAASIDKLRQCSAYLMMWSTDAGRCLSLKFANGGETDTSKHTDLSFFLDAAHGDEFSHQTMDTRRKIGKVKEVHPAGPVPDVEAIMMDPTNVTVMWLIQLTIFANYWCQVARNWPIGLVQRILFSFAGTSRDRRDLKYKDFFDEVTAPIVRKLFTVTLGYLGPKATGFPDIFFQVTEEQMQAVQEIEETLQEYTHPSRGNSDLLCSSMPKCMYWLGSSIMLNHIVSTFWPRILADGFAEPDKTYLQNVPDFKQSYVSDSTFLTSVCFIARRYMFGQCVINRCVIENLHATLSKPKPSGNEFEAMLECVLRSCPSAIIDESMVIRSVGSLGRQLRMGNLQQQTEARAVIQHVLQQISLLGFGKVIYRSDGNIDRIHKFNRRCLSTTAEQWLHKHRIPVDFWGMQLGERTFLPSAIALHPSKPRKDPGAAADKPDHVAFKDNHTRSHSPQSKSSTAPDLETTAWPRRLHTQSGSARVVIDVDDQSALVSKAFSVEQQRHDVTAFPVIRQGASDSETRSNPVLKKKARRGDGAACVGNHSNEEGSAQRLQWAHGHPIQTSELRHINNHSEGVRALTDCFVKMGLRTQWLWKGDATNYYRFRGICVESENCPVTYQARLFWGGDETDEVRQFGDHSEHTGEMMQTGTLLSARQESVANSYQRACLAGRMTLEGLIQHWQAAGLQREAWQDDKAIRNWLYRENKKAKLESGMVQVDSRRPMPVVSFEALVEPFRTTGVDAIWQEADVTRLFVLPQVVITSDDPTRRIKGRGYVPFTCKGMLLQLLRLEKDVSLVLAVDAKVGRGNAAWRTASIGFYKKSELAKTTLTRRDHKSLQMRAYTTSFCPVLQARMHQETNENWSAMFNDFVDIIAHVRGIEREVAKQSCFQCAKDFNDAIENGRKNICPDARPIGDPTHMWARFGLQLPRKCRDVATEEPTAASQKPNSQQMLSGMEAMCTLSPTIDILDVVLEHFLVQCTDILKEQAATDYLRENNYVVKVAREQVQRWHIEIRDEHKQSFWFCPAWQGLFGAYPGMQCGTQPVEAFHGGWQRALQGMGMADQLAADLTTMQTLYRRNNTFTRLWQTESDIKMDAPRAANPDLIDGDCLRRAGLSPSMDYWQSRSSGIDNAIAIAIGDVTILAISNKKCDHSLPATTPVPREKATYGAEMLFLGGLVDSLTNSHSVNQYLLQVFLKNLRVIPSAF